MLLTLIDWVFLLLPMCYGKIAIARRCPLPIVDCIYYLLLTLINWEYFLLIPTCCGMIARRNRSYLFDYLLSYFVRPVVRIGDARLYVDGVLAIGVVLLLAVGYESGSAMGFTSYSVVRIS